MNTDCLVLMPMREKVDGYENNHFRNVYEYLIKPACELANFTPVNISERNETFPLSDELIRLLGNAEMSICDISSLNENVMFELGFRCALLRPITIIKDNRTNSNFYSNIFKLITYNTSLAVTNISNDIKQIANNLINTYENREKNSLSHIIQSNSEMDKKLREKFNRWQKQDEYIKRLKK